MKKNKTALSALILSGIILLLLSGCYELATQQDGALALNTSVSGRKLMVDEGDAGDNDLWVVGFVIEASSEESVKELLELNDRHDYGADNYDEIQDIYMDLAMGGALRFDGGRPFFQFEMPRIDAESATTVTGNFSIQGIPADREYFLHLIVIDDAISTLDDLEEKPLAQGGTHYFDADSYGSYTVTGSETSDTWSDDGTQLESGWYMFNAWVPTYAAAAGAGEITSLTAEIVTDSDGNPQGGQPFFVEPGETVKLNISLVETPDLP